IPDGWMACDPESNRALRNAPQIIAIEKFCRSINAHASDEFKPEIHVFVDSDPSIRLIMGSFFTRAYVIPDEYITNATPQMLDEVEDLFGNGFVGRTGFPIGSCTLHATTFGGRPAFLGETETKQTGRGHFAGRFYLVSGKAGTMSFVLVGEAPISARAQ